MSDGTDGNTDGPSKAFAALPGSFAISTDLPITVTRDRKTSRWLTTGIIIVIWVMVDLSFTTAAYLAAVPILDWPHELTWAIGSALGALISFGIVAAQNRLKRYSLATRALAALGFSIIGTAVLAGTLSPISYSYEREKIELTPTWMGYWLEFLSQIWTLAAVSGIILALSYVEDIREREERISALHTLAHSAQLRALRNQLNPHFLFNALNSIASLVSRNRGPEAEAMTVNLADFLRATLALDPQKEITLDEEITLQTIYLNIEKARFPDRLKVNFNIPDEFKRVLVPNLITQPLIENSIKHAVARSTDSVQINLSVTSRDGRLHLVVEDDGGNSELPPAESFRVGLSNVAERLRAHYGDNAYLQAAEKETGGFCNVVSMPMRVA